MPTPTTIELRCLSGPDIHPWLDAVAALRIAVFREWPYLYDGDRGYEARYLEAYAKSSRSLFVLALDEGRVVGASTGLPLIDDAEAFRAPFDGSGIDPGEVFYFGESVLDETYRGRGLGHRFFDERERHARELGFPVTAFAAVVRDLGDPRRPDGYRPLDTFWRARGYAPREGLVAELAWKEVFHEAEETHRLQFWLRDWRA